MFLLRGRDVGNMGKERILWASASATGKSPRP